MQSTIVIPTFNEAENLPRIVCDLLNLPLDNLKIIIVDDNSPDGTGEIAERLVSENPGRIAVLHRPGKLGLGTAYIAGFKYALAEGAQAIGQMDADFSHPPTKIIDLAAALETCDVASGSRYIPGGKLDDNWPLWRKWLSSFGNWYAHTILGLHLVDVTGGFRLWRRETLLGMPLDRIRSNGYMFQVEMAFVATRLGYRFAEVPFYFSDRRLGKSKMSFRIQFEAAIRTWQLRAIYRDLKKPNK